MSGSATAKAELRALALARRDAMRQAARIGAARAVADRVAGLVGSLSGAVVSGFLPIRTEIDIRPLMATLAAKGARLCVPAIVGDELQFREFRADAPLVPQGFGTLAPGEGAAVLAPQVMLVPLAAFDRRLHRIGYGRGYYDRAIAALAPRLTIGVAFACQEVDAVPDEPHDVALDFIATEAQVLRSA